MPTAPLHQKHRERRASAPLRWLRFLLGLAALTVFFAFFASGVTPPGVAGEVLRHNRTLDIDASPLLYSEVEYMAELEAGVRAQRAAAEKRAETHTVEPR